jgi:PAS domain S-box-containing protein
MASDEWTVRGRTHVSAHASSGAPATSPGVPAPSGAPGAGAWVATSATPATPADGVEMVLLDRDGVIVATDRNWLEFCLANGGDPVLVGPGASYLAACDVVADEDPASAHVAYAVRTAVRGMLPAPMRIRIPCHAPDSERWFDVLVSSRHDNRGECVGATVALSPVPPPRAGTPAQWRAFDLVPDPVCVLDAAAQIEYTNPAGLALLGHREEDLVGRPFSELDTDAEPGTARTDLDLLRDPGSTLVKTCNLRRADGSSVPVEAHVRSVRDDAGQPRFVVVSRDLRARRSADALARRGEQSFLAAFDRSPIGMAVVRIGPDGRRTMLLVNDSLGDFFHVPADRLVGRDMRDFSSPDNLEHDRQVVEGLLSGRMTTYARRKRWLRGDGSTAWAEVRVSRVELPDIEGPTTLAHFVDVTERHEAEQRRARRATMNAAIAEIVTSVLAGIPVADVHQRITEAAAQVFDAESVTFALPDPATGDYRAVAGFGPIGALFVTGVVPVSQPFVRRLVELGSVALPGPTPDMRPEIRHLVGPAAAARFGPGDSGGGLIVVIRAKGGSLFSEAEVGLLVALAQQVALAVELEQARVDQQRLAILEDRQRIARDLHDTVIQDLIAVGMQLDAGLLRERDPDRQRRDAALVDQLEEAVRRLRGSVFDLREPWRGRRAAETVRAVVAEATRILGHAPSVRIDGADDAVPTDVVDALVAVLREGLSNVARHAGAHATEVTLTISADRVRLVVEDDGRGLPAVLVEGDGLANIRQRAVALRGTAGVGPRPSGGARMIWECPIAARA